MKRLMKRLLSAVLATGLVAASVQASDLNVSVQRASDGASSISVSPGEVVNYQVTGMLSDDLNEGLALVGFNLVFDGGDLAAADTPAGPQSCLNPMAAFVKPEGITNPDGYGGTIIGGNLIQVGGGQNTIRNPIGNADFPIGEVQPGVAQPAGCGMAVLATGSLTAPAVEGVYHLNLQELFANVIVDGDDGDPFWVTAAAGVGDISNLEITVASSVCGVASTSPPNCAVDAGYTGVDNTRPRWDSVEVTFGCTVAGLPNLDFSVTTTGVAAPTIMSVTDGGGNTATLNLSGPIEPGAWTCFTHDLSGDQTCLGFLPADANGDLFAGPADILDVIDNLNGVRVPALEFWQCDVDRSGVCGPPDILGVIDLLNGSSGFDAWNGETLGACPSAP